MYIMNVAAVGEVRIERTVRKWNGMMYIYIYIYLISDIIKNNEKGGRGVDGWKRLFPRNREPKPTINPPRNMRRDLD